LIRLTREFTRRITNQDRQRLALDLRESGHQRLVQASAPVLLQQFFAGETDLDAQLVRRYQNAPLLSHTQFSPRPGEPVSRQATALISSQDDSASLTIDAPIDRGPDATLNFTFTLSSMLGLRFPLVGLSTTDRRRWLDLMRRENGIAFLWTHQRWEQPYLIFVVREHFGRIYAFAPQAYEAAVRLTPDTITETLDWLEGVWFADSGEASPELPPATEEPTYLQRPAPLPPPEHPHAPEEQWDEPPAPASDGSEDSVPPSDLEW